MQETPASLADANTSFSLGSFQVHPERNSVRGPEGCTCLEPKLMAVLTHLAAVPGATVTKSELLEQVWPRRYVVEGVLKRAVSELRRVLGDDARSPRYIETVYKKGYRLIAVPQRRQDRNVTRQILSGSLGDVARLIAQMGCSPDETARATLIIERRSKATFPK